MGESLNLSMVAERVETAEQAAWLISQGWPIERLSWRSPGAELTGAHLLIAQYQAE
jgi:hypothetical protein